MDPEPLESEDGGPRREVEKRTVRRRRYERGKPFPTGGRSRGADPAHLVVERLLDSTIIYASSDCGPGWSHSLSRQPIVLVGHGRNKLVHPGIHYEATPNTNPTSGNPPSTGNTADVLLTVLQAYDENATQIGDLGGAGTPPGSNTPLGEDLGPFSSAPSSAVSSPLPSLLLECKAR